MTASDTALATVSSNLWLRFSVTFEAELRRQYSAFVGRYMRVNSASDILNNSLLHSNSVLINIYLGSCNLVLASADISMAFRLWRATRWSPCFRFFREGGLHEQEACKVWVPLEVSDPAWCSQHELQTRISTVNNTLPFHNERTVLYLERWKR